MFLDLTGTLDTSSVAALDVTIRNHSKLASPDFHMLTLVDIDSFWLLLCNFIWARPLTMSDKMQQGTPEPDHPSLLLASPGMK